MLKRAVMIGVIGVSLALMRGDDAEAHLAGTVYKPTYRHISSYDCTGTFGQVPSLDQHRALFECVALVHEFQVLCQNPQGKVVTPGVPSGPRTVQIAEDFFTEADLTDKTKGKAIKTLALPDSVLAAGDAICRQRNRNWRAVDELVLTADVTLKTFNCLDDLDPLCAVRAQAFEALLRCTVPEGFSLPNNPPPGGGTPTEYNCTLIREEHCDQGGACPIDPIPFP